jgi:6-phosphogluconate dehydrogenase (decarboxylating)
VQLGPVSLGRMGANMRDRLRAARIGVLVYSRSLARDVTSSSELVAELVAPRTVWIMVAAAGDMTRATVTQSAGLCARFASRQPNSPAIRSVAAWRRQFGGHVVQAAGPDQSL